ncbi:MAG: DUF4627 domain-containing protein [Bacteroidales bacterium]
MKKSFTFLTLLGLCSLVSVWQLLATNKIGFLKEMLSENLIPDPGFDQTTLPDALKKKPYVLNQWMKHIDLSDSNVAIELASEPEQGNVVQLSGKPGSYFKTCLGLRLDLTAKKGIYRLSFKAKSDNGGKAKVFIQTTDAAGEILGRYFVRNNQKPTDPEAKWYGSWQTFPIAQNWNTYSVDFDLTLIGTTMYQWAWKDVQDVMDEDLKNFVITFQNDVANTSFQMDDVSFEMIEDLSGGEEPAPAVNLVHDAGFDQADLSNLFVEKDKPLLYNLWTSYVDQPFESKQNISYELKDDPAQGKVVSFTGKPYSFYTGFIAQRIKTNLDPGIYRLSFRGRTDNAGKIKTYLRLTNETGDANRWFVKETGRPTDPAAQWYGSYNTFSLTKNWADYTVDFNTTLVSTSMYKWTVADAQKATQEDLTDFSIVFLGDVDNETIYFDNVKIEKIKDLTLPEEPAVVTFNFEEDVIPSQWKSTKGAIALSNAHFKEGVKSLEWDAVADASLTVSFKEFEAAGANAAFFQIRSSEITGNTVNVEFLNAQGAVVKTAHLLMNFKGWREFNRPYNEYQNSDNAKISNVRFVYKTTNTDRGQKIYIDDVNLSAPIESTRYYSDFLVEDLEWLEPKSAALLKVYAMRREEAVQPATPEELEGMALLRDKYKRTATPNTGALRQIVSELKAMNMHRNDDGTIVGPAYPSSKERSSAKLLEISQKVEILGASAKTNNTSKNLFNDWIDLLLDQGVLYSTAPFVYSDYNTVRNLPAGFLNAMDIYTDEQREEMIKAVKWILEFNLAYADYEYLHSTLSSDYIYNYPENLFTCAAYRVNPQDAVTDLKALKVFLENASEYSPGSKDILKPDGTGFHHNTHYNNYMYAYTTWVNTLYNLVGTVFQVDEASYERVKKAVVATFIQATASENNTFMTANSLAGRHPLVGGPQLPYTKQILQDLIVIGGDIKKMEIDRDLAAQYNAFTKETLYEVAPADMQGFYQFNYSPAGVYRKNDWVATMRCPTTKFWGGEIYSKTNRFGRYQAHGTLEVMYEGPQERSGFPAKDANNSTTEETGGWDWNVEPGSTTVHYTSWAEMMPNRDLTSRFDQYAKTTNFAGALSWGDCGMFGAEFDQGDSWGSQRFTPTNLSFKKSVYAFDGLLISLGNAISSFGNYGNDMITATNLFQGVDCDLSGNLIVNDQVMEAGAQPQVKEMSENVWLVTPQGTGYFIPAGNDPLIIKHGEQSSPNETGSNLDNPKTVVAAKAYIDHGVKPNGKSYEFVVMPGIDAASMKAKSSQLANGEIYEVKAKTENVHALFYKPAGIMAYTCFGPVEKLNYGMLKSTTAEMLLMEKADLKKGTVSFAIANPNLRPENHPVYGWTATPTSVSLVLNKKLNFVSSSDQITVTDQEDGTTRVDLVLEEGAPVYFTLSDPEATSIDPLKPADKAIISVEGSDIYVRNANKEDVALYEISGRLLSKKEKVDSTVVFNSLAKGYYLVKIGRQVQKVVIKD